MRYESRTVVKQRTDEERRRRHLYGDSGAKFTSKKLAIGGYNDLPHYCSRKRQYHF